MAAGAPGKGIRLVVNEILYTGPISAGQMIMGLEPAPGGGVALPRFGPIQVTPRSFVLADELATCQFSYLEAARFPDPERWRTDWVRSEPVAPGNSNRHAPAPSGSGTPASTHRNGAHPGEPCFGPDLCRFLKGVPGRIGSGALTSLRGGASNRRSAEAAVTPVVRGKSGAAKGSALLTVLWLAAALAAVAFAVATTVRGETERATNAAEGTRAYYLAAGAVERAALHVLWGRTTSNRMAFRGTTPGRCRCSRWHFRAGWPSWKSSRKTRS